MSKALRVLHLTPHLGGGVGSVIRGYLDFESKHENHNHRVASLDVLNPESKEFLDLIGIDWEEECYFDKHSLDKLVSNSDVVLIHWWNHPLLQELLMNRELPESRVILWSHISGNADPNSFSDFILNFPDKMVFTTPLSFANGNHKQRSDMKANNSTYIWSTTGVEKLSEYKTSSENSANAEKVRIGYVGNLDYTKLHQSFFDVCKQISGPDISFTVIGPSTTQFNLDLEKYGQRLNLEATGYIPEFQKFRLMSEFDILLYPLARNHYGTCDQVLQEAMALGVVPVVLNNEMESFMVTHREDGLIANSIEELVENLKELIADNKLRETLGIKASTSSFKKYRISSMSESWNIEFSALMEKPKRLHATLASRFGRTLEPNEVFMQSLSTKAGVFELHKNAAEPHEKQIWASQISCLSGSPKWSSPTKSSPSHFSFYFPGDSLLKTWSELTSGKI
jgi:glycosyltransferase involved in cell wall biosynthesis